MTTMILLKLCREGNRYSLSAAAYGSALSRFVSGEPYRRKLDMTDDFLCGTSLPLTGKPELNYCDEKKYPVYRVLSKDGDLIGDANLSHLDSSFAKRLLRTMISVRAMDDVFYNAQRQGRLSFYATSTGEEALQIGSASALSDNDIVYPQYREPGVLMWRGFSLKCVGNVRDNSHGRQMPVHYGSRAHNFKTVSTPLATQIPQAVGAAYALKRQQLSNVTVCYFGDGAASEGDFHAGMNFASTLDCPVIFFCRNNGYAISTPVEEQYRGDGIVSRASGYGMASIRVDGNDVLAIHEATKVSRDYAVANKKPVLIEALTYRIGHHSTSDDWKRSADEVKIRKNDDPINRFFCYAIKEGLVTGSYITETYEQERDDVLVALKEAEKAKQPHLDTMFEDIYQSMPKHLVEQKSSMLEHMRKYPGTYPLI